VTALTDLRLIDLHPQFLSTGGDGITRDGVPVPLREGVGVECDCPCGCSAPLFVPFANPIGGGPPVNPGHVWQRTGETFETLTLTPSIQRVGGCAWHGFITNGKIVSC
jgi:hypothetical protein